MVLKRARRPKFNYQAICIMHAGGMKVCEIAAIMGCAEWTVRRVVRSMAAGG